MQVFDRRLHRQFWRGEVLLTRTINGGLDNMPYGLGNFTWTLILCQRLSKCLCCELKCRFILVGLIVIKVFPRLVGLMTLLDHHHGKSIKINVSYKIGILDLI